MKRIRYILFLSLAGIFLLSGCTAPAPKRVAATGKPTVYYFYADW